LNKRKRIVITGASGYLGGRIIDFLISETNVDIIAISRRSIINIWPSNDKLLLLNGGYETEEIWSKIDRVDILVHLAAPSERDCEKDPMQSLQGHFQRTCKLLDYAKNKGVKQIVYMSTIHVYGSNLHGSINELTPTNPIHAYALMHSIVGNSISEFSNYANLNCVELRLSNSFGSPVQVQIDRWELLVNSLCKEAVIHGTLTLKSDGKQLRNFIAISDVVTVVNMVIKGQITNGIYNLCSDETISVLKMTMHIKKIAEEFLKSKITLNIGPKSDNIVSMYQIDNSKLKEFGWVLSGDIKLEIKNTLQFCKIQFG
jgi:UDP-glucose 4-epimerase